MNAMTTSLRPIPWFHRTPKDKPFQSAFSLCVPGECRSFEWYSESIASPVSCGDRLMGGHSAFPCHNQDLRKRGEKRSLNLAGTLSVDQWSCPRPTGPTLVDRELD